MLTRDEFAHKPHTKMSGTARTLRERMVDGDDSLAWETGVRLGPGELASRETLANSARYWFLRAIERRAEDQSSRSRRLIVDLRQLVFPAFEQIFVDNPPCDTEVPGRRAEFHRVGTEWAAGYNLCRQYRGTEKGAWVYEVILENVECWRLYPKLLRPNEFARTRFERSQRIMDHDGIRRFVVNSEVFTGWNPELETKEQFQSRIKSHVRCQEDRRLHQGLEAVPTKHLMVHFDWLVRLQIEGHRREDIAKSPRAVSVKAIDDATRKLRRLIDLPTNPAGRRRREIS